MAGKKDNNENAARLGEGDAVTREETEKPSRSPANEAIIKDIRNAIAMLDYGTVTIKVHNAKIVQIEITQKKRFDDAGSVEKGGGI